MDTLFTFEQHVTFDELSRANFDFFKQGELLSLENESCINKYYKLYYDSQNKIPFYHCLPTLNHATHDRKFRFLIVEIGNDTVFFAYKIIQIMTTKQIRVFDEPISLNRDANNVDIVIHVLKNKSFVRFVFADFVDNKMLDKNNAQRLVEYDNYYYTRQKVLSMSRAKLKKRGIIDLIENDMFSIRVSCTISKDDAILIRNDFNKYLRETNKKISKADDNEFFNVATCANNKLKCVSVYYKNKIVYCSVFLVLLELKVVYKLYDMQSRYYDDRDSVLKKTLSLNMTEKMKYIAFKVFKDIDVIYILGCMPNEHRLIKHKEMKCEGKIKYYIQ